MEESDSDHDEESARFSLSCSTSSDQNELLDTEGGFDVEIDDPDPHDNNSEDSLSDDEPLNLSLSAIRKLNKNRRQRGKSYLDSNNNIKNGRSVKAPCKDSCFLQCSSRIPHNERETIHKQFWNLDDRGKLDFYRRNILTKAVSRRRCVNPRKVRNHSNIYHFEINGVQQQVCQRMFLQTLDVNKGRVEYFIKTKTGGSAKGYSHGSNKSRVVNENVKDKIRQHIDSVPRVQSHYCRQSSSKEYFEDGLNLKQLYTSFKTQNRNESNIDCSYATYRKIFKTEYNISFHKPRKDICDKCHRFDTVRNTLSEEEIQEITSHRVEKDHARKAKEVDRMLIPQNLAIKNITIVIDLQNVLPVPMGNVGTWFFFSKLNCYHQTATVLETKKVYSAFWNESVSGRTGNDMASAWSSIMTNILIDHPQVENVTQWSDSCVAQNKNKMMSLATLMFIKAQPTLKSITFKFGEPGHCFCQEIDAVHSTIERKLKILEIGTPQKLFEKLKIVKINGMLMNVKQMEKEDFKDFEASCIPYNFTRIPFCSVKFLKFTKESLCAISYKTSHAPGFIEKSESIVKSSRRNLGVTVIPNEADVDKKKIKVSASKIQSIKKMMKNLSVLDQEYYKNLFSL